MSNAAEVRDKVAPDSRPLVTAGLRMLRPVVRLFVGKMSFGAFQDIARQLYVEEAHRKMRREQPNARITQSALAVLTGLDTRLIANFMEQPPELGMEHVSQESALLHRWNTDPNFQDPDTGEPATLLIHGPGRTFQSLVMGTLGRNVTVKPVMERLTASGNIEKPDRYTVRMVSRHYSPINQDDETFFDVAGLSLQRLGLTLTHNYEAGEDEDKWLQQARWSRKIDEDKLPDFRKAMRELIEKHLDECEDTIDQYENKNDPESATLAGIQYLYWEQSASKDETRGGD